MTRAKAEAASDQCPLVIKWLKWAVLEELDCAAHVPYSVGEGDYQQRQAWEADSEKMRFKPPNDHPAFRNLVGTVYDDTMLTQDYGIVGQNSNNVCKTVKPAYLKASATDMRNSLDSMGIRTKEQLTVPKQGPQLRCALQPSKAKLATYAKPSGQLRTRIQH
ncbi:hypothetical protein WJX82_005264 [Trebouxia sp. C0006]